MSGSRRHVVLLVALGLLLSGCASGTPTTTRSPGSAAPPSTSPSARTLSSPAAQRCGRPDSPAQALDLRTADGLVLPAFQTGSGPRGVVLVHESGGQALCGWWPYAAHLGTLGYHVLIYDTRCYGKAPCPQQPAAQADLVADVAAAVSTLRAHGARSVVLVGASLGGSVVLASAADPPPGVTAVASLSGDLFDQPMSAGSPPLSDDSSAARVRLPVLFALAPGDPLVTPAQARSLLARMPSRHKSVDVLTSSYGQHGWNLLAGGTAGSGWSAFDATLRAFLHRWTG